MLLFLVWRIAACQSSLRQLDDWLIICFAAHLHQVLAAGDLVDETAMSSFIASCQFRYGGIAKTPGEHPGMWFAGTEILL